MSNDHRIRPEDVPASEAWRFANHYLGRVLESVRNERGIGPVKIAAELSRILTKKFSPEDIEKVEAGTLSISLPCQMVWCRILGLKVSCIIQRAEELSQSEDVAQLSPAGTQFDQDVQNLKRRRGAS